jgi:hypothetical protein
MKLSEDLPLANVGIAQSKLDAFNRQIRTTGT